MAARVTYREVETLMADIEAYLAAVHTFREEGCEPRWRLELAQVPRAADRPTAAHRGRRGSAQPRKGG